MIMLGQTLPSPLRHYKIYGRQSFKIIQELTAKAQPVQTTTNYRHRQRPWTGNGHTNNHTNKQLHATKRFISPAL